MRMGLAVATLAVGAFVGTTTVSGSAAERDEGEASGLVPGCSSQPDVCGDLIGKEYLPAEIKLPKAKKQGETLYKGRGKKGDRQTTVAFVKQKTKKGGKKKQKKIVRFTATDFDVVCQGGLLPAELAFNFPILVIPDAIRLVRGKFKSVVKFAPNERRVPTPFAGPVGSSGGMEAWGHLDDGEARGRLELDLVNPDPDPAIGPIICGTDIRWKAKKKK